MSIPRAEIGREIPKNLQYLKNREQAFIELLKIFQNITAGQEYTLRLPDATKKYSQYLSVSDREPLIKAVDDWNKNFLDPAPKKEDWAKILSMVMSSGVNRLDVESPGLSEVKRLIPFSPFKGCDIVAHVSAYAIISPNEILNPRAHHEHYLRVRRKIYEAVVKIVYRQSDILMGAEYFFAGKFWPAMRLPDWETGSTYLLQILKPIDRRGG